MRPSGNSPVDAPVPLRQEPPTLPPILPGRSESVVRVPLKRTGRSESVVRVSKKFSTKQTGLDAPSTALVDHARFLDRRRLQGAPIGHLQTEALTRLDHHLARVFGLAY